MHVSRELLVRISLPVRGVSKSVSHLFGVHSRKPQQAVIHLTYRLSGVECDLQDWDWYSRHPCNV